MSAGRKQSNTISRTATLAEIDDLAGSVVAAAISEKTAQAYQRGLNQFREFCDIYKVPYTMPFSCQQVVRFITFLFFLKRYAYATIQSMISALSYVHTLNNLQNLSESVLVKRALMGIRNLSVPTCKSIPMPKEVMEKVVISADGTIQDSFKCGLFKAMTALAFYGLLRVGEFTKSRNCLQLRDILLSSDKVQITFRSFKHSHGESATINVLSVAENEVCPVLLLRQYLTCRGTSAGSLFQYLDGTTPTRLDYWNWLASMLHSCNIPGKFSTHSLRKGGASHMALMGYTEEQIRLHGRWHSDAYKKYICGNNFL